MRTEIRKAAVRAWKERKPIPGIYAISCATTGLKWVGRAPDVATVQTRIWFGLRTGSSPHRKLQQSWREHGEAAFQFEVLERFEAEMSDALRNLKLKNRLAHWKEELRAEPV